MTSSSSPRSWSSTALSEATCSFASSMASSMFARISFLFWRSSVTFSPLMCWIVTSLSRSCSSILEIRSFILSASSSVEFSRRVMESNKLSASTLPTVLVDGVVPAFSASANALLLGGTSSKLVLQGKEVSHTWHLSPLWQGH